MTSFAAMDFETADFKQDSACSVGVVVVRGGQVAERFHSLIRPPRKRFVPMFVELHGITWDMVRSAPPLCRGLAGACAVAARRGFRCRAQRAL